MIDTSKFKTEKDVKKQVKKLLDKHGWFWWMPPANGFGRIGVSDFHALRDGVFMAIETKFGNNKPTPAQKAFLETIAGADGIAFVVSDKNLDWFEVWLAKFDQAKDLVLTKEQLSPDDGAHFFNAQNALIEGWVS